MQPATSLLIPTEHTQRALYLLEGEVLLDDKPVEPHSLLVLPEGEELTLYAQGECQLALIGGPAGWAAADELELCCQRPGTDRTGAGQLGSRAMASGSRRNPADRVTPLAKQDPV